MGGVLRRTMEEWLFLRAFWAIGSEGSQSVAQACLAVPLAQNQPRVLISDVAVIEKAKPTLLPKDVIYVGHRHFWHHLAAGPLANPFQIGQRGSALEVLTKFLLPGSYPGPYACDCPLTQPCRGHALVTLHLGGQAAREGTQRPKHRGVRVVRAVPVEVGTASSLLGGLRFELPCPFLQDVANIDTFLGCYERSSCHAWISASACQAGVANQ